MTERVKEENKMKKLIAILLVLLVASVAFGEPIGTSNTPELTITATAAQVAGQLMLTDSALTTVSAWNGATPKETLALGEIDPLDTDGNGHVSSDVFLNLKSNTRGSVSVGIKAQSLSNTIGEVGSETTSYIQYDVVDASDDTTVIATSSRDLPTSSTAFATFDGSASNGMSVFSKGFFVDVLYDDTVGSDSADFAANAAYQGLISFEITAQ